MIGIGTRGKAPYRSVLTHGFLVDGEGRKMSKSLGNAPDPQGLLKKYGAELMRLWVAGSDYRDDIEGLHHRAVRMLKNALEDFEESDTVDPEDTRNPDAEEQEMGMGQG